MQTAVQAIKDTAPRFSTTDFMQRRGAVEAAMKANITTAIAPIFSNLIGFQLISVTFPDYFYKKVRLYQSRVESHPLCQRNPLPNAADAGFHPTQSSRATPLLPAQIPF
jgi:hypothetical protein